MLDFNVMITVYNTCTACLQNKHLQYLTFSGILKKLSFFPMCLGEGNEERELISLATQH